MVGKGTSSIICCCVAVELPWGARGFQDIESKNHGENPPKVLSKRHNSVQSSKGQPLIWPQYRKSHAPQPCIHVQNLTTIATYEVLNSQFKHPSPPQICVSHTDWEDWLDTQSKARRELVLCIISLFQRKPHVGSMHCAEQNLTMWPWSFFKGSAIPLVTMKLSGYLIQA